MSLFSENPDSGWYCVRSKPKCEHIAARHLQGFVNLDEVFCPRIRYEKVTQRGKVWFTEALFPGYLFAKFDLASQLRAVNATTNVSGVLRFADNYPMIPDPFIAELRKEFPEEENEIRVIEAELDEGDEVVLIDGPLAGLNTIVTGLVSGQDRIRVLLEWLGQEREVEVPTGSVMRPGEVRTNISGS
tara:strand:+ start:838 stop:1398 length:561 start_codon:yes stop_codon:yes gene_type:complete